MKTEKIEGVTQSTFLGELTAGKNVSSWGGKTAWLLECRAYTSVLTTDFK
jgi:hypothetical protein